MNDVAVQPQPLPRGGALLPLGAWVIYSIFAFRGSWTAATAGALAIYLWFAVLERRRSAAVKLPDLTALGFFVLGLIATIAVGPWLYQRYSLLILWFAFAATGWSSMALGAPFAVQYARETSPPEQWDTPVFVRACKMITLLWCGIFSANLLIVFFSPLTGHPLPVATLVPLAGVIFGFVYTARYTKRMTAMSEAAAQTGADR